MRTAVCLSRFALMPAYVCDCAQINYKSKYVKETLKTDRSRYTTSEEVKITVVGFLQARIFPRSGLRWMET